MPAIGRAALDSTPFSLPLDEMNDVARHLAHHQAQRHVGESNRKGKRDRQRNEEND